MAIFNSWLENPWKMSGGLPWGSVCLLLQPTEGVWEPPARPVQPDLLLGPTQLRAPHSVNLSGIYE